MAAIWRKVCKVLLNGLYFLSIMVLMKKCLISLISRFFFHFFCIPNMRILTPIPIIDSKRAILHIQIRSLFTVVPNFALPPTPIRTRLFSPVPNINSLWKSGLKFWFYYCVPSQKYGFFASGHFCIFPILQNWIQQKPQKPNWLMTSFMNGP